MICLSTSLSYILLKTLCNNGSLYRMTLKLYNQQISKKMRLMKIACKVTIHTKVLLTCQNKTFRVYLWLTWYLMISQNYTASISKVCFRKIPISEIHYVLMWTFKYLSIDSKFDISRMNYILQSYVFIQIWTNH